MGDELKWLLKAGVGIFSRTLSLEIGPPHLKVGPPRYSNIQICNVITSKIPANSTARIVTSHSWLTLLACYLLPDCSHDNCVSVAQPPPLKCLVRQCLWRALVLRGQTELCPDCVRFSCCRCSSASACSHAHTVQSIISPFVGWAYFQVRKDPCNNLQ